MSAKNLLKTIIPEIPRDTLKQPYKNTSLHVPPSGFLLRDFQQRSCQYFCKQHFKIKLLSGNLFQNLHLFMTLKCLARQVTQPFTTASEIL